jgi:hypothetical protein
MPIRINLLAEHQAAEETRRRDPVKRFAKVAACLVVMVLVWSSSLQVEILAKKSQLNNQRAARDKMTNEYSEVIKNEIKLADVNSKLVALNHLAAERFLQSTMLNTLLHATVDGIQITRLRTEQGFDMTAEVKATKENPKAAKPASTTEKSKLTLDAKDMSPNPGNEQINKFKETLAQTPYFMAKHISIDNIQLKNLSTPQLDAESGKSFVLFSLECLYPEKRR